MYNIIFMDSYNRQCTVRADTTLGATVVHDTLVEAVHVMLTERSH